MEAAKRIEATDKLEMIDKVQKKKEHVAKYRNYGVRHFLIWVGAGTKVDTNTGNPKLGKKASVAIVKVLLPGIDPGSKDKDYKTMVACKKWLGDLAGGTTWVDDMKSYEAKIQDNTPVPTSLFWFSIY